MAAVFSTYGYVHGSVMVGQSANDLHRVAFLEMPNVEEASRAIEQLNGRFIDGQVIEVKQASSAIPSL